MNVNPREVIGGNNPPEPTEYERVRDRINDLYAEASQYLIGDPIASQGQADDIGNLLALIREAEAEAEEARKSEAKPWDDGKAGVQARYAPLIANTKAMKGKAVMAAQACKKALEPWMAKLEEERQAKAREAREEAERKRVEAVAAVRSRASLEQAEEAERLLREADKAAAIASKVEASRPKAGGGLGRAISQRTVRVAEITDKVAFARYVWSHHADTMGEFLAVLAQKLVDAKTDMIPGVEVRTETKVV